MGPRPRPRIAPRAGAATLEELLPQLPEGSYDDRAGVIDAIAATGDPRAAAVLAALGEGALQSLKSDGRIVRLAEEDGADIAYDALTGERIGPVGRRAIDGVGSGDLRPRVAQAHVRELAVARARARAAFEMPAARRAGNVVPSTAMTRPGRPRCIASNTGRSSMKGMFARHAIGTVNRAKK